MENELEKVAAPTLTFGIEDPAMAIDEVKEEKIEKIVEENKFTEEEKKMIDDFSKQIDLKNTNAILQYGASTQTKMADFSEKALGNVRTKDMGEIGDMITGLVTELKSIDTDEDSKGIVGFFKKKVDKLSVLKTRYDKAEVNVNKITNALEDHQVQLMKDIDVLDKMYDLNLTYFKEISMYIEAGKVKIEDARNKDLPELTKKAAESGLPEDAQEVKDFENMIERFEKKISDLELSRMLALQTAPQLRLVQSSNTVMVEKIQSTLVNTIPLWKNQMVIALGIQHSTQAAEAQRKVSDMTNELLKKNAAQLKVATIETAKEAERGIIDIETLKNTNASLISTLDEVVKIQEAGREKRKKAEVELQNMEKELKEKLLDMKKNQ